MSSEHFDIQAEDGGCRIRDLGSSNGLFLNERQVDSALAVEGDEIRAGGTVWKVVARGGYAAPGAAVAARPPLGDRPFPGSGERPELKHGPLGTQPTDDLRLELVCNSGESRWLAPPQRLTIGRAIEADWCFSQDQELSSMHMEIYFSEGAWRIKDLQSTNGSYVNEDRFTDRQLLPGDIIRGGQTRFSADFQGGAARPTSPSLTTQPEASTRAGLQMPGTPSWTSTAGPNDAATCVARLRRMSDGRTFDLAKQVSKTIGRSADVAISLADDGQVSMQHATVLFDGNCVKLQDIGSSNGTFVDGRRVQSHDLNHGENLRVGQTEFAVELPSPDAGAGDRDQPTGLPAAPPEQASEKPILPPAGGPSSEAASQRPPAWSESEEQREFLAPPADADQIPYFTPSDFADRAASAEGDQRPIDSSHAPEGNRRADAAPAPDAVEERDHRRVASAEESGTPSGTLAETGRAAEETDFHDAEREPDVPRRAPGESPAMEPEIPAEPIRRTTDLPVGNRIAGQEIGYQAFPCGSGLMLYRGISARFDPVDVSMRLLAATSGWVLDGAEIESWIDAKAAGVAEPPGRWLSPARTDDASWMLPFSTSWGSDKTWLVYARADWDHVQQSLVNLRHPLGGKQPLVTSLSPTALTEFLANRAGSAVQRFFSPLDAILLEVHAGTRWALFGRKDLEPSLSELGFVHRHQW